MLPLDTFPEVSEWDTNTSTLPLKQRMLSGVKMNLDNEITR